MRIRPYSIWSKIILAPFFFVVALLKRWRHIVAYSAIKKGDCFIICGKWEGEHAFYAQMYRITKINLIGYKYDGLDIYKMKGDWGYTLSAQKWEGANNYQPFLELYRFDESQFDSFWALCEDRFNDMEFQQRIDPNCSVHPEKTPETLTSLVNSVEEFTNQVLLEHDFSKMKGFATTPFMVL